MTNREKALEEALEHAAAQYFRKHHDDGTMTEGHRCAECLHVWPGPSKPPHHGWHNRDCEIGSALSLPATSTETDDSGEHFYKLWSGLLEHHEQVEKALTHVLDAHINQAHLSEADYKAYRALAALEGDMKPSAPSVKTEGAITDFLRCADNADGQFADWRVQAAAGFIRAALQQGGGR